MLLLSSCAPRRSGLLAASSSFPTVIPPFHSQINLLTNISSAHTRRRGEK